MVDKKVTISVAHTVVNPPYLLINLIFKAYELVTISIRVSACPPVSESVGIYVGKLPAMALASSISQVLT